MYPGNVSLPPEAHDAWPAEEPIPARRMPREESSNSTHISSKRKHEKRPQISDAMRARLGPQAPRKNKSYATTAPGACLRPSNLPVSREHAPHQPKPWAEGNPLTATPPGSISRRLDDMLSTPFSSRIIDYEPPRGFIIPKFSTYDGSSDPFDHIMHYR